MKTFIKSELAGLRLDINEALRTVAEKHDIEISAENCRYEDMTCTFQLKCKAGDQSERQKLIYMSEVKYARLISGCSELKPEHFGVRFNVRGEQYEFNELSPRRSAFPIGARSLKNGKQYKFRSAVVSKIIGTTQAA